MFKSATTRLTLAVLGGSCMALGLSAAAVAGDTDTATSEVTLTVLQAISVDLGNDMDFGTVYTSDSGTNLSAPTPATFNVSGAEEEPYDISVPATVDIGNGTTTATVELSAPADGTLTGGTDSFGVDGTIASLPAEAGSYTGNFTVTVSYSN